MLNEIDKSFYKQSADFFESHKEYGLTYDDVSLATQYSEILPREANTECRISDSISLRIPIISSDMDTVTESSMAIAMALNGGMGLIHYNMSEKQQIKEVHRVKNHIHGLISDPITVSPDIHIADVLELVEKKQFKFTTFPVVDESGKLLGLLPGRIVKNRYRSQKVGEAMTPVSDVFTLKQKDIEKNPIEAADQFFNENMGIHKVLVVDESDKLCGLFTLSDVERIIDEARSDVKPARDTDFRLQCGAAVSATRNADNSLNRDRIIEHAGNLIEAGVNVLAVSTAHGHTRGVGDVVKILRGEYSDLSIIAGNVTSAEGVEFLADCGADAIKVGQGPGSICTTRVVAGVGIPQLTALYVASQAAAKKGVSIIADGGVTKSGDIVKALTLADSVILGGLLAGCRESPGSIVEINGKFYKQYRGMGSLAAMREGSATRYGHETTKTTRTSQSKVAAEGVEALKEISGTADEMLANLVGGLQSGMGYLGADSLKSLRDKARFIRVTAAGQRESSPHDIVEVKLTKES